MALGLLLVVVAACAVLVPQARLALTVLLAAFGLLLVTPSWFPHYASLVAGPAAVCVGAGMNYLVDRARTHGHGPTVGHLATGTGLAVLVLYSAPTTQATPGRVFPGRALQAAAAPVAGCITADDPTTLIEMNVVSRNLEPRAVPWSVDLGGWTYDHPSPARRARANYPGVPSSRVRLPEQRRSGRCRPASRHTRASPAPPHERSRAGP